MKESLLVSEKGQITLPVAMRRALGIGANAIVTAEQQGSRIILMPAMVVETEQFDDADVAAWNAADAFAPGEKKSLEARLEKVPGAAAVAAPKRRGGARG